jgi:Zn-dependent protease with chaperone function
MDPYDPLAQHLPSWAPLARPLVVWTASVLVSGALTLLLLHWTRPRGGVHPRHWTDWARDVTPQRQALGMLLVLCPIEALLLLTLDAMWGLTPSWAGAIGAIGALLSFATVFGMARLRGVSRATPRGFLAFVLLRQLPLLTAIGWAWAGASIPLFAPWPAAVVAAVVTGSTVVTGGYPLVRALGWVRPGSGPLAFPDVEVVAGDTVNAFAFVHLRRVLFTERAVDVLTPAHLRAVLAHERGHLAESTAQRAGRLLVAPFLVVLATAPWLVRELGAVPTSGLVMLAFAPVILLRRRFRQLESAADVHAQHDPDYPAALEAVYRWNLLPAVATHRTTHPDLVDRLTALGAPPAWPPPAPPVRYRTVPVVLLSWLALAWTGMFMPHAPRPAPDRLLVEVALGAPLGTLLVQTGDQLRTTDPAVAHDHFRAALAADPDDLQAWTGLAWTAAVLGDRATAREGLARIQDVDGLAYPWIAWLRADVEARIRGDATTVPRPVPSP